MKFLGGERQARSSIFLPVGWRNPGAALYIHGTEKLNARQGGQF
jgi:hypothetical protein